MDKLTQALAAVPQRRQRDRPANILSALLAVQQRLGYVPPDGIQTIAGTLGVTEAEVAGVLSYYPDLRRVPPPRHVIRICMGESCVANHSGPLLKAFQERLQVKLAEPAPAQRFELEQVFCLGNCAVGPTVGIDEDVYGRATVSILDTVLDRDR